jgi:hypothetical protein
VSRSYCGILAACVLLVVTGTASPAQTLRGWENYRSGTIAGVIQANDSSIRADTEHLPAIIVSGNQFPTLARVTYCGTSRPLDANRRQVLRTWGLSRYRDTLIVLDFRREYLFQEGKRQLWLPVEDTVASFFAAELKPGQQVSLYVSWIGAHYAGKEITWAFLVSEFQAGVPGPRCDAKAAKPESGSAPLS